MKKTQKQLIQTWDEHAKRIKEENIYSKELLNDPIRIWLNNLKNKNKLKFLDVGCGVGQYVFFAKEKGFKTPIGLEISPEAVKIGKQKRLKIVKGDMRSMPFEKEKFDIVVAGGSIEHFPETEKAFEEINRILKKEGFFFFNVPYRYGLFTLSKLVQKIIGIWKCGYEKSFSEKRLRKYLAKNDFKILEVTRIPYKSTSKNFLSKLLEVLDKISFKMGFGGPHIFFKCQKIK